MFRMTPEVEAVLSRAAELRAEGSGWNATADELEYETGDLKQLCKDAGRLYDRMFSKAQRQVIREGLSESMFQMRKLLRSADPRIVRHAADSLARISMTMIRHRRRGKPTTTKKPQELDPRLAKLSDRDAEFVLWLSEQSDADLEAQANRMSKEEAEAIIARAKQKERDKEQGNGDAGGNPVPRTPRDPSQPTGGQSTPEASAEAATAPGTATSAPEPQNAHEPRSRPRDFFSINEHPERVSAARSVRGHQVPEAINRLSGQQNPASRAGNLTKPPLERRYRFRNTLQSFQHPRRTSFETFCYAF